MNQLQDLIGRESDLSQVGMGVRRFAQSLRAPVVGAYHVTCSDETERECEEAFQRLVAAGLLPALKHYTFRAPFRSINLGGRYEWGAAGLAEQHFALPQTQGAFKLLVVKINAHAGVRQGPQGPEYGWYRRYGSDSACCGALAALVGGARLPALEELAETFAAGELDRVALLRNPEIVAPEHRALLAAVVNARLQAERATSDICAGRPHTPTVFLVLPCVTINRPGPDTELVVGQGGVDWTGQQPAVKYYGLGDDPAAYRVRHEQGRVEIEDDQWPPS